jgi:anaerobic selenocysteine-containing dehydrogenase
VPDERIRDPWGPTTGIDRGGDWPERVDVSLADGLAEQDVERWVQSACVLCSNGCGCDIAVKGDRIVGVRGRAIDRVNRGRLGPKGLYAWQANNSPDRLTRPLVREGKELVETDWDTAMSRIAERMRELLDSKGPQSIGFYNSGQLFLEDYYALGILAHAGVGTPHVDGNTRLCTATAAQALKESFGCDGQPGSYADIEETDALFLWGHNVAETQTVLWARMRDRLEGASPPQLVVVDPRPTVPAARADVHLALRNGTNLALMNALVHEVIENGWVDEQYVDAHTVGFDKLVERTESCTPEWAAEICGVDAGLIREAARIFGTSDRVLSTVLQGFYQSHLATASACQVNNLHLLRGLLGRPGAGILQMNGQPTAQNTRETGANGDLAGFRNWQNQEHLNQLAELWGVPHETIPHTGPPTHAMEIFRYAELGTINLLWVIATNPAVSMPELRRIRKILDQDSLFLVVQDTFLTETARYADVVLPTAIWGEKTGTFTNADRTVHLSERAVSPPGDARPDLDVFLDFSRRMGFTKEDGSPLLPWSSPEEVFDAWRECSRGRPCDYSGLSYDALRGSGIQWPVTAASPQGTARLYTDGVFPTDPETAEDYGHDLNTGGTFSREEYEALVEPGKAILKSAVWSQPPEGPTDDYPLLLTTGRTVFHFHTRTKTGRTPQLQQAAPQPWVEISPEDAAPLGLAEGDLAELTSPRGSVQVRARLNGIRRGVVFVPFHYGRWQAGTSFDDDHPRTANELTITAWDPVSRQPYFKVGAVKLTKVSDGDGTSPAPAVGAPAMDREA